jgi:hypothetical protein
VSQAASGYERIEGDAYFTPHWVTEALLSVEKFPYGGVWDPAAGAGHMLAPFKAAGHTVWGSDINPAADGVRHGDFFDMKLGESMISSIVTNPPYGVGGRLAVKFIERSLELMRGAPGGMGKVAMLLRVDFDSAATRAHIFGDHPAFAAKYTLTKRVRWANLPQVDKNGKKTSGPTDNHALYVWDWSRRSGERPYYGYLPLKS